MAADCSLRHCSSLVFLLHSKSMPLRYTFSFINREHYGHMFRVGVCRLYVKQCSLMPISLPYYLHCMNTHCTSGAQCNLCEQNYGYWRNRFHSVRW